MQKVIGFLIALQPILKKFNFQLFLPSVFLSLHSGASTYCNTFGSKFDSYIKYFVFTFEIWGLPISN